MLLSKRMKFQKPLFRTFHDFKRKTKPHCIALEHSISIEPNISESIKALEFETKVKIDSYTRLLEACIQTKSLREGKIIHHHILNTDTCVNNTSLLEKISFMYITCEEIKLARLVFDRIQEPSIFLWNSMIRAYAWNGPFSQAIDLYYHMLDSGLKPNKFTLPFVLKACSGLLALEDGREIHNCAKRVGLDTDVFVCTALIDMYVKCGCLDDAHHVFDKMPTRDVVAWNAMVAGSSLHGHYKDAIGLVFEMQEEGTAPNSSTVVAVLPAVAQVKAVRHGKCIHCYCIRRCLDKEGVLVGTALLDMYAKCECLSYAQSIFNIMSVRNEVTWSAMIGAYVQFDRMGDALGVFDQMMCKESHKLTAATLGSILRACSRLTDLNQGKRIHCYSIKSGFDLDIMVGNSFLSMYAKGGMIDDAISFFDEMTMKDTVSYSAIISGCVQNGNAKEALLIFQELKLSGVEPDIATMVGVIPACAHLAALQHGRCNHSYVTVCGFSLDTSVGNALIDMYSKCGRIDTGREIFERMLKRDIVSWNAIIAGYGIHGLGMEALSLFNNLQDTGLKPDDVSFICLLSACSHSGLVTEGKHWFYMMSQNFKIAPRMEHCICMVDLLGRGGLLDEAHDFILKLPFEPDIRVWGALLGACRIHKNIELGEEVSKAIQRLGPEGTGNFVLLSNIYSAAGRWDDAANVRIIQKNQGFKKSPGCSWIEVGNTVHAFVGGDRTHPQSRTIYDTLEELLGEMKKMGYEADLSFVLQNVEDEEKERILLYHSEKLAIAFGILRSTPEKHIFVTKNLRVCGDCHTAIKFITRITSRVITVRDATRFHHFRDGVCNCGDFW